MSVSTNGNAKVKMFDLQRGFGFLRADEDFDIFVHVSALQAAGIDSLSPGTRVNVEFTDTPRGPKATKIALAD
jgi:cold shock protein